MKLIVLTQYFPPEVGAAQNRLYELVMNLKDRGVEIEVLTAMPNYPKTEIDKGYKGKWYVKEAVDGVRLHRAWIFVSSGRGIVARLLNYFSFVFTSFWIGWFKLGKADYLFCESPPLFLGISALFLKKMKGAKLIFNVADLWPETAEKMGVITNKFLLKISRMLEERLYTSSAIIVGQTQGIVNNIKERFPAKTIYWMPNGVDVAIYNPDLDSDWREKNGFLPGDFILIYPGTIGQIYSWDMVFKAANELKKYPDIKWVIIGSGQKKDEIVEMKKQMNLDNVFLYDPVPKTSLPEIWKAVDLLFLPLRNIEINKGVVPAKSFEAMAMKVPMLLGAEGEAKKLFIDEGQAGLAFKPEDAADFMQKILYLYQNKDEKMRLGNNGRRYVEQKFDRRVITNKFYDFLMQTGV